MKTLINKLFIVTACVYFLSGCDNDLNEKVFSSITQQSYTYTEADFNKIINAPNNYAHFNRIRPQDSWWTLQEITADAIVMPPNASGWDDGGRYRTLHYHLWNAQHDCVVTTWTNDWRAILLANNALDMVETDLVPAPSPAAKESAIAELRAVRAYLYWDLCDNFGDVPLVTAFSSDLPEKSSRKEIYDFVVSELTDVIPMLSEVHGGTQYYGRFNKWAAKALLANVYLNAEVYTGQARWNECIAQCDDIINSGKSSLAENYNASFRAKGVENVTEVLYTIPFDPIYGGHFDRLTFYLASWHGELKKRFEMETTPWGSGTIMGVTQFIDTYDLNDTRLEDTWLMGPQFAADGSPIMGIYDRIGEQLNFRKEIPDGHYTLEDEGYRMFKYEVEKGASFNLDTDYPIFRYAQVLMMKAECLLRLGQPGAGALVTQVRQRNFKDNPAMATVTDEQLKDNSCYKYGHVENYVIVDPGNTDPIQFGRMYDELGWEFAWEGFRRRDMIRFGHYTKKSWLSKLPQGNYRTVFPIPQSALNANPKLVQNPNYQ